MLIVAALLILGAWAATTAASVVYLVAQLWFAGVAIARRIGTWRAIRTYRSGPPYTSRWPPSDLPRARIARPRLTDFHRHRKLNRWRTGPRSRR